MSATESYEFFKKRAEARNARRMMGDKGVKIPEVKPPMCRIEPLGKYGQPWKTILAGCEWCEFAVECFLMVGRNFPAEMRAQEELERDYMHAKGKQDATN